MSSTDNAGRIGPSEKDATRLFSKITLVEGIDCWQYTGYRNPGGYGQIYWNGRNGYLAHRAAYELAYGPIPPGLTVDHKCNNPSCIRYEHLEAVSQQENQRRAVERRTHCRNGHEWTVENTYLHDGHRHCRACNRAAVRRYTERRRHAPSR